MILRCWTCPANRDAIELPEDCGHVVSVEKKTGMDGYYYEILYTTIEPRRM